MKVLIYPHTYPRKEWLKKAIQFFSALIILQPTENIDPSFLEGCSFKDKVNFIFSPLGKDLSSFFSLVKAYETWGREVLEPQSFSIFHHFYKEGIEELLSIKREIIGSGENLDKEEKIFTARLILQLAHNLDRHMQLLEEEYLQIENKIDSLKNFLWGEEEKEILEDFNLNFSIKHSLKILPSLNLRMKAFGFLISKIKRIPSAILSDQEEAIKEILRHASSVHYLGVISEKDFSLQGWAVKNETPSLLQTIAFSTPPQPGQSFIFLLSLAG